MIPTLALLQVLASTSLSWSPRPGWLVAGPLARSVLVPLLLMAATRYWVQGGPGTFSTFTFCGGCWQIIPVIRR